MNRRLWIKNDVNAEEMPTNSFFNFTPLQNLSGVEVRGSCWPFFTNGNILTEDCMRKPVGGDIVQKNRPIALVQATLIPFFIA